MATFIWDHVVFGPITSRRFGISLGINLLPEGRKICTFDCIYCECGWTETADFHAKHMPSVQQVSDALKKKLEEMGLEGVFPDAITFAGNGEPTMHPHFHEIIKNTIALRNQYCPKAKITVLTNSTLLMKKDVLEALKLVDNPVLKLDAGNKKMYDLINLPKTKVEFEQIIQALHDFPGQKVIQTMFLRGELNNQVIDNTKEEELNSLIAQLKYIHPVKVMIYGIDRDTPAKKLVKISKEELEIIAEKIRNEGFEVSVA